tara:strand:+ start:1511 stop:1636 length:126 start_codon:yes stop_codon:yes gene_type:complete
MYKGIKGNNVNIISLILGGILKVYDHTISFPAAIKNIKQIT